MKKGARRINALTTVLAGVFVPLCALPASAQESSLWGTHYRPVIVNTKASGAGVSANVAQFPLLVRLDSANAEGMFTQVTAGGGDLRVTNATGTDPVHFEIESWDAAGQRAAVWVLADLVKGNDSAVAFRLYWGRSGAVSNSNPGAVFDTANGFQAVWHFSEGNGDTAYDATVNRHNAAPYNAPADTMGVMGRARKFNGTNQRFQIPNSASGRLNLQLADSYTLSAWTRPAAISTTANSGHKILDKGDNQYTLGVYDNASPKYWDMNIRANNRFLQIRSDGSPLVTANSAVGTWLYTAGTFRGAPVGNTIAESLFIDGVLVNTLEDVNESNVGRNLTYNVNIGVQTAGTAPLGTNFSRYWNGALDEVRIENRARSAAWLKLTHATQKPAATAVKLGVTVSTASLARSRVAASDRFLAVSRVGDGLVFRIGETDAASAQLTLRDMNGKALWNTSLNLREARETLWTADRAAPGLYALRVRLADANGKTLGILDRMASFMW